MLFTLADQIEAVDREIRYRKRVYDRRVDSGKMTRQLADRQIALMEAVRSTLAQVDAKERLI